MMILDLPEGAPDFREIYLREDPLAFEFKAAMDASPAFTHEVTHEYPETGYLLHVYVKTDSAASR